MATNNISILGLRKDISAMQGKDIYLDFTLSNVNNTPLDMTGYLLNMQVRKNISSREPAINATLANGKLSWLDVGAGKFRLHLVPADTIDSVKIKFETDAETWDGYYDLEVTSPSGFPGVQTPFYGSFTLTREITRV